MRILVATDQWSPDVVGGSARVAADTARALARRGHELVVLAPAQRGLPVVEDDNGVEVRRELGRGRLPQTLADPPAAWRAARRLRARRFDVLVAHQATNAAGLSRAGLGAPLALVFHASAVLELRFLRARTGAARRAVAYTLDPALVALERSAVRRAASVLVLSRFSERLVVERHPSAAGRVHVVGGGVEERFFEPPTEPAETVRSRLGVPADGILLFTARRLEPRMGVEQLISALERTGDDRLVLAVTGDGPILGDLAERAAELGLEGRVRLLGRVSEADLVALYAAADLFVLPTVAYEGFGMSTVEALAQGTPVLGTAVGATPEILGELGDDFVSASADPEVLAEAIRRVVPLLGPNLSKRAHTLARTRYAWETAIQRWEAALEAMAGG